LYFIVTNASNLLSICLFINIKRLSYSF